MNLILAVLFSFAVRAETTSMTFSAKVKSFDAKTAIVEINRKTYKVKRSEIMNRHYSVGDAVLVTIHAKPKKADD